MSEGAFQRDLIRLVDTSRPVALVRFGDGEYHLLNNEPYRARSGWALASRPSWLRDRIEASLVARLPNYWVGISPPCDWPVGTAYYRPRVKGRRTFATVFSHANYHRFRRLLARAPLAGACLVGPGKKAHHKVPLNGVVRKWDLDGLVEKLLKETRPILVAAGPCACVIVHEYWKRCEPAKRQTILDVGAAIDPLLHGRPTRDFHEADSALRFHVCSWDNSAPWSPSVARKKKRKTRLRGYRAYQAKRGTKNKDGVKSK